MLKRNVRLLVAVTLGMLAASTASAGGISGSFTGIVTSSETGYDGRGNINGQSVTGTFGTQFTSCPAFPPGPPNTCYVSALPETFNIASTSYRFGTAAYEIPAFSYTDTAAGQTLSLAPDEGDPHGSVFIDLAGPAGAFITGGDLNSLHGGPVYASASTAFIAIRQTIVASIQLTSVQVDGVAGVPEPATWTLMIAGFGLTGLRVRTRRRRAA